MDAVLKQLKSQGTKIIFGSFNSKVVEERIDNIIAPYGLGEINNEMKRLRQNIARAGNEIHRQNQRGKARKKEKEIINQLRASMDGNR